MKVNRLPVADEVTREGETVVMIDGRVILLSPLASAVLRLTPASHDLPDLAERLVQEFGAPSGANAELATVALVKDLEAAGLVVLAE